MTALLDLPIAIDSEETVGPIDECLSYLGTNLAGGFTQMPDGVRSDPTLSRAAKLVYEQLLYYMRQRDFCWPSQQRIADDLGTMSRRTVIRAIKELHERGFIERYRRGLNRTNVYFINPLDYVRSFRRRTANCEPVPVEQVLSGKCQIDSPASVVATPQDEPDWHAKQTKSEQTQQKHTPSNHSTTALEATAIGNPTEHDNQHRGAEETKSNLQPKTKEEIPARERAIGVETAKAAGHSDTATAIAKTTGIPVEHLAELGVETEPKRRPIPDFIANMMTHFCAELGDKPTSVKSSITRATKIYYTACLVFKEFGEDPEGLFIEMMYQAKRGALSSTKIKHRGGTYGNRVNRIPLFFACLEHMFEFQPKEVAYLRSDAPLLL